MLPGLLIALLLLLVLVMVILLQQHYDALAQPTTTNQNVQNERWTNNQSTIAVDDNELIKNSSSLSLLTQTIFCFLLCSLDIKGSLTTSSLIGTEISFNSTNEQHFTAAPLRDAEVKIITADATDPRIINTTSVRTDSLGTFSIVVDHWFCGHDATYLNPCPLGRLDEREVVVFAYFEGNENVSSTYDVRQVTVPADPIS
jgi:hypothetical protein